jgi:hypothetical protein
MFLFVILLNSLIFIYSFQIAFAQHRLQSLSPPPNPSHASDSIFRVNKQSELSTIIDEVSIHYPTPQEKGKLDKIVNQTLSMLQPIGRAINESHSCILEAVICGSGNMTNGRMLKL